VESFQAEQFVEWFRHSSPYINAHRKRTFVVYVGGEALREETISGIVHDLALLNSLGVKLVVVHGARPQIDSELKKHNIPSQFHRGVRITDVPSLKIVQAVTGQIRSDLEARFSTGLANSPMAGARIRIAGGNLVMAKPLGIHDGVDFAHSGEVRRIDSEAINHSLDFGAIVLLSPVGYSLTGEAFNISAEEVATDVAIYLKADKLILYTDKHCLYKDEQAIRQLSTKQAEDCLNNECKDNLHLLSALRAAKQGVRRAHLINYQTDGALLQELFTRDGIGTLITAENYDTLRQANIDDVAGILELITPLEDEGVLVRRSRELLENEIDHFTVLERDGTIIGCAALYPYPDDAMGEMACLTVHPEYRQDGRGESLAHAIEKRASSLGLKELFVLTSRSSHWFLERAYKSGDIDQLPMHKKQLYNYQRKSKVFLKAL
jgi:amino-acid N-acetyltransferase